MRGGFQLILEGLLSCLDTVSRSFWRGRLHQYTINVLHEPIAVQCTGKAGHGKGQILGKDDSSESPLVIYNELFIYDCSADSSLSRGDS